jgi:hypothetical protein
LFGDFELEDHDGDDDGEDSVGEGFEARGGEELFGHGVGVMPGACSINAGSGFAYPRARIEG